MMLVSVTRIGALALALAAFQYTSSKAAASPAPSPSPSATTAPADPCGGEQRLLATLNRPTIGYSACAAAPGTVIFEEGFQNTQQGSDNGTKSVLVQYPQSFIRYGVSPRFEVDLIGPYYNKLATPDGAGGLVRTHGYQDSGVGFKYEFVPSARYTIGVDGLYTAPNGSTGFTNGGATATGNLDIAYQITPTFGAGTTIALSSTSGFDAMGRASRYTAFMPSAVLTTQLPDAYQLYAEYVYLNKLAPDQGGRAFVDYGVQHLFGKRFEIDVELGETITPNPTQKFTYFGFGFGFQLR